MGEVWLARHAALDMLCAVKLLDLEAIASSELRARFELEARAAAEIRSAHVVQILDHGVFEGRPCIVMEYLKGEDLGARLTRDRVLDARATAAIITQAARAVDRAQEASIVHRDLKPANLFLCREGDGEIVKVLDFGVAKRLGGSPGIKTSPGMLIGTLFYMSLEQAQRNRPVDHRSDLWALGAGATSRRRRARQPSLHRAIRTRRSSRRRRPRERPARVKRSGSWPSASALPRSSTGP